MKKPQTIQEWQDFFKPVYSKNDYFNNFCVSNITDKTVPIPIEPSSHLRIYRMIDDIIDHNLARTQKFVIRRIFTDKWGIRHTASVLHVSRASIVAVKRSALQVIKDCLEKLKVQL
jgi:hypothetical protein